MAWLIVHRFTSAEAAIGETLLALHRSPGGTSIRLDHLAGQRCQQLADALSPDGAFAAVGAPVFAELSRFREQLRLRNLLCHGAARITLDQRGRWFLLLELLSFQGGASYKEQRIIDQTEARVLHEQISPMTHRLSAKLADVRKKLGC